ncbi:MAG: PAS domain S-box protein, partial [Chlamydiota bacterium]
KNLTAEQEAQQRFERLFRNNPVVMALSTVPDQRFFDVNNAFLKALGYSMGEVVGKTAAELGLFLEAGQQAAIADTLRADGRIADIELQVRRRDGAILDGLFSGELIDIQGRQYFLTVMIDVTERKQADEERKKTLLREQRLNVIQQSLLTAAPIEDKLRTVTDGIVRSFDADFCRIWLIRPGDLCELDCVHAGVNTGPHVCRYRDRCLHLLASSGRYTHTDGKTHRRVPFDCYKIGRIASGEDHRFLTNDVQNDPRIHNHEWARELGLAAFAGYQLRISGGDILGVMALFSKHPILPSEDALLDGLSSSVALAVQQSVTAEALRESEENYRALFNESKDAIMTVSPEEGFLSGNPEAVRIYGCRDERDFISRSPAELSPEYQPDGALSSEKAREMMLSALAKGSCFFEWTHKRVDGTEFPATVLLSRMEKNGKAFLQATVRDISEHKRAEEVLQRNLALYEGLIETTDTGFVTLDQEGKILNANQKYVRLSGHENFNQIRGRSVVEWTADYEKEKNAEAIGKCFREGHIKDLEIDYVNTQGKITPIEINATVIKIDGVPQILTLCRDVTERKRAEETLRESEARFRNLLQDIQSIAIQGYGTDGTTQYWNQASEHLYGYSAQEAIGRNLLDLIIPPEMRGHVEQEIRQMAETGQPIPSSELSLMRKDGSRVTVFSSHARVKLPGHAAELFCLDVDISERKRIEEALLASEKKYRDLFNENNDAIFIANAKTRMLVDCNRKAEALTGYSRQEILSMRVDQLHPEDVVGEAVKVFGRYTTGDKMPVMSEIMTGDKKRRWVAISPAEVTVGGEACFMGVFRDMTELKNYQQTLEERNRELEIISNAAFTREFRIKELRDEIRELKERLAGGGARDGGGG